MPQHLFQEHTELKYQEKHTPQGMQMTDNEESPFEMGTILVRDLPRKTTEDELKRHFMRFGGITEAIIPFDGVIRKPHSFGFVTFSDPTVITVVLCESHPINGVWAEVSRAMKGEDLQTLESQRILPRNVFYYGKLEGPGDSENKSIFVSGPIFSGLTRHEVVEYFLGYDNMFSNSFTSGPAYGLVVFSMEHTVNRVLQKHIHDVNGKLLNAIRSETKPESIRYLHMKSNVQPSYDHDHGSNGTSTYGGVDIMVTAPGNQWAFLGSPANVTVGDQRLEGKEVEVRQQNISAPNATTPQTRPLIMFESLPFEADFGNQNMASKEAEVKQAHGIAAPYLAVPYTNHGINLGSWPNQGILVNHKATGPHESALNTTTPDSNYHANLGYPSDEGVFGNHKVIRPHESAPNTTTRDTNRGINLGYWSNDGVLDNHMVTQPYESAPSMTCSDINRGIDLGYQSSDGVFGNQKVAQAHEPATNTTISQTNHGISLGYSLSVGAFGNNKLEGKEFDVEQLHRLVHVLSTDAGESSSNNQPSQEEFEFQSYNGRIWS